jgi:hypothetical protein
MHLLLALSLFADAATRVAVVVNHLHRTLKLYDESSRDNQPILETSSLAVVIFAPNLPAPVEAVDVPPSRSAADGHVAMRAQPVADAHSRSCALYSVHAQ